MLLLFFLQNTIAWTIALERTPWKEVQSFKKNLNPSSVRLKDVFHWSGKHLYLPVEMFSLPSNIVKSPACDPLTLGRLFGSVRWGLKFSIFVLRLFPILTEKFYPSVQFTEWNFKGKWWKKRCKEREEKRNCLTLESHLCSQFKESGFEFFPFLKKGKQDLKA